MHLREQQWRHHSKYTSESIPSGLELTAAKIAEHQFLDASRLRARPDCLLVLGLYALHQCRVLH
jgi:hypothetical protein